jgi:hypothetical protein
VIECIVEDEVHEDEEICKDDAPAITEANVNVGTKVKLISDREAFKTAFNAVGYVWFDSMEVLLGAEVSIVDRPSQGIFGLPKSDPSSW